MFRNQIDERKVIDAVKRAIEIDRVEEPRLLPGDPNYPEQVWIELPIYCGLTSGGVFNLQKALHRRDLYSISIHVSMKDEYTPVLRICAYAPEMHPSLYKQVKDPNLIA